MVGNDYPVGYEHTKDVFLIHIKFLWGLIEKNAVPSAPDPSQLNKFYQHFSTPDQIKSALENNGPALVPVDTVQTLHNARIRTWAQNLYEQPDSLYNEACRISALKTFRQLVVGDTYQFMNVNQSYINNLGLLTKSYDHYVHFYFYNICNKEQVENRKHCKDNDRRALQESCTKLCDLRDRFAISQNFPKQYIRVLKPIAMRTDVGSIAFLRDPTASLKFKSPDEKMGDAKFTEKNWDDATKDYNLNFLVAVEYNSENESSEGTESDYGESIEMEASDEEEEENGNPNNENDEMAGVKGKGRESYSKYDEDEEAMELETTGQAGYYGGLTEEEWDQRQ
ncbi:hypothetical protein O181_097241 [Austropuccinia psidii MF-1]|uniref:Uncharacterized protein n=1 Tax=Austropuccinia psidii MF-1 TaxID=1389203 RepID=A0A9Q3PEX6_9BASI|nr:hypothetical protein [Austropuccinia psidii MF-1]